jgi:hypothetical protein
VISGFRIGHTTGWVDLRTWRPRLSSEYSSLPVRHTPAIQHPRRARVHPRTRQAAAGQVGLDRRAELRQAFGLLQDAVVLLLVTVPARLLVTDVLAAARVIDPHRLDVAIGERADPHVAPGRRDHQGVRAWAGILVRRCAGLVQVLPALAPATPGQSRPSRVTPPQPHA